MNVENALKLADYIENEAKKIEFKAKATGNSDIMGAYYRTTPCGTIGCILGSFATMKRAESKDPYFFSFPRDAETSFCAFLGVTEYSANRNLILTSGWPEEWREKYFDAQNLFEEMLVMANYLRYLADEEKGEI